jgi:hypothetical protein
MQVSNAIEGTQSFLINLQELAKLSDPATYPYCEEINQALAALKVMVDRVNEAQRAEENKALKADLVSRIEDWKVLYQ